MTRVETSTSVNINLEHGKRPTAGVLTCVVRPREVAPNLLAVRLPQQQHSQEPNYDNQQGGIYYPTICFEYRKHPARLVPFPCGHFVAVPLFLVARFDVGF